jgi:DNA-binding beta-propeller fold protein YncE
VIEGRDDGVTLTARPRTRVLALALPLAACYASEAPERPPAPGTIMTVAGNGERGYSGDGGPAGQARLSLPVDSTLAPDGDLLVVDFNNHVLRRVSAPRGAGVITTLAGTGEQGHADGPVREAAFVHPSDIVFAPDGNLLVAAWHNSRVRKIDAAFTTVETIAGTGERTYRGEDDAARTAALDCPVGVELDEDGNVYFVDQFNHMIRRVARDGSIARVAGSCVAGRWGGCQAGFGGDGGPALEARFALTTGAVQPPLGKLALAPDGAIYFADAENHRIRVITPDGGIATYAGSGAEGFGGDGGPALTAELDQPADLELGPDGTLYVVDREAHCVRAVAPDGIIVTVAGRCGQHGFAGDGGDARAALLDHPSGVEVDRATGDLYVADTRNHRIRLVVAR